ncbi:MAG: hypothetical protein HON90_04880 [Halobacteriovoraceae bacterium]|jgi:hypothetical protein|nr:hypothetical protein [Halobacteriovoraceae bacterium]
MKIILLAILVLPRAIMAKDYYQKNFIDKAHETLSEDLLVLSNNVDEFFADSTDEKVINKSKLKITLDTYFREAGGPYVIPEVNYRLILPMTQKKLQLFIESEDDDLDDATNKASESIGESNEIEETNLTAGMKYIAQKSGIDFSTSTGVLVNVPMVVFSKFNAQKIIVFQQWILKIDEQIKWVNSKGFTSNLDMNFDRSLSRKHVLRMVNNVFWNDEDYSIRFKNGPSLFHKIDKTKALSYHAHVISTSTPSLNLQSYLLQTTYRQLVYRKWLFMEASPYVTFSKEANFHRSPGFLLSFEAVLGYMK